MRENEGSKLRALRWAYKILLGASLALLFYLALLAWNLRSTADEESQLLKVTAVATALVASATVAYALVTLRLAWHAEETAKSAGDSVEEVRKVLVESKRERSLSLIARWNDPAFLQFAVRAQTVLAATRDSSKEDPMEASFIIVCLFLTELALAVDHEAVDEQLLRDFFETVITGERFYPKLRPWVAIHRGAVGADKQFRAIDELYRRWRRP